MPKKMRKLINAIKSVKTDVASLAKKINSLIDKPGKKKTKQNNYFIENYRRFEPSTFGYRCYNSETNATICWIDVSPDKNTFSVIPYRLHTILKTNSYEDARRWALGYDIKDDADTETQPAIDPPDNYMWSETSRNGNQYLDLLFSPKDLIGTDKSVAVFASIAFNERTIEANCYDVTASTVFNKSEQSIERAKAFVLRHLREYLHEIYEEDNRKHPNIKRVKSPHHTRLWELDKNVPKIETHHNRKLTTQEYINKYHNHNGEKSQFCGKEPSFCGLRLMVSDSYETLGWVEWTNREEYECMVIVGCDEACSPVLKIKDASKWIPKYFRQELSESDIETSVPPPIGYSWERDKNEPKKRINLFGNKGNDLVGYIEHVPYGVTGLVFRHDPEEERNDVKVFDTEEEAIKFVQSRLREVLHRKFIKLELKNELQEQPEPVTTEPAPSEDESKFVVQKSLLGLRVYNSETCKTIGWIDVNSPDPGYYVAVTVDNRMTSVCTRLEEAKTWLIERTKRNVAPIEGVAAAPPKGYEWRRDETVGRDEYSTILIKKPDNDTDPAIKYGSVHLSGRGYVGKFIYQPGSRDSFVIASYSCASAAKGYVLECLREYLHKCYITQQQTTENNNAETEKTNETSDNGGGANGAYESATIGTGENAR